MAAHVSDRIPLFFILAPLAGIAAWLGLGKVGLELLAIPVLAALLCNVVAAVHHAEVVALRVGEPFGGLILALAVTVIEAGACPCKTETTSVVLEALGTRKKSVSLFR